METVAHYLPVSNIYEAERETLREEVGEQGMRVEKLLGYPKFQVIQIESRRDPYNRGNKPDSFIVLGHNHLPDMQQKN